MQARSQPWSTVRNKIILSLKKAIGYSQSTFNSHRLTSEPLPLLPKDFPKRSDEIMSQAIRTQIRTHSWKVSLITFGNSETCSPRIPLMLFRTRNRGTTPLNLYQERKLQVARCTLSRLPNKKSWTFSLKKI